MPTIFKCFKEMSEYFRHRLIDKRQPLSWDVKS